MNKLQPIYRKDYTLSEYLIHTTELEFDLTETQTIVTSKISFYKNPKSNKKTNILFLDGIDLELISILVDKAKPDYKLVEQGLEINNLADEFILEIKNCIHPEKNTSLYGLYQSNGNFCTQCEAHGFRQITYYLDRPDVLSVFTTHIKADKQKYLVLLSNGNLIKQINGSTTWHDPTPKPCYLFALVVGNFALKEDTYITLSGNEVTLKIYVQAHNINKTQFAMAALKRSFAWEEKRFGLEYDLDIYMIVAVDDFNMGAMENKGLNIFNTTYVLASIDTVTDKDFIDIEAVIGHEYFHNWTGNRVTCRDWFQLSLKEGLTVFRDQEFTSDLHTRSIKRIEDVNTLRTLQFAEDMSSMQHLVRPEHYIEMNNFYTLTVYEKGAEIIRMVHTFLGEVGFQKGMQLYFQRFDGDAVTIDDFIQSMSDANNFDFDQFMYWYSQSGTPEVSIVSDYNHNDKTFKVFIRQHSQCDYFFPLRFALLDDTGTKLESGILTVKDKEQIFIFNNMDVEPTPSWLRGFSAPIKLKSDLTFKQKIFLVRHDSDAFNQWDNAQQLWLSLILIPSSINQDLFFDAIEKVLKNTFLDGSCVSLVQDKSLICEILTLPSEQFLHQQQEIIDVFEVHDKREKVINKIIERFKLLFSKIYSKLNIYQPYELTPEAVGNRALKNICLYYLAISGEFELAFEQFKSANCMNDKMASLKALIVSDNSYKNIALDGFYHEFKNDTQVMDKYFSIQSSASTANVESIKVLMQHKLFSFNTPNRLRSVIGSFSQNYVNFHNQQGYELLTNIIIKLNQSNPQIGAKLTSVYNHWQRFTPKLKALQKQQLEKILAIENLSNNIFEIIQAALK
ncbi:aminopeptidase N [Candidatus Ruthia magnifica str. Cm (Calyptogena magnifica)]|uniref:Aminopeptidase N n=1 Tax=Ruthia magnifica subsp. Calyptogena magnifica TaxID=413404 RepID=A1AW92_RUTMC|nr:aminopeptidase N [Candidatus Ruthturnera calyptogenae]ABL02199.1 aminopeptidase N [Candidatus Ruthia magnifica str. Cm (Calyptogena magnifica)]